MEDGRTSVSDQLLKMEMLSQAAKELEIWKNNEKKKFTEQLTQVSVQLGLTLVSLLIAYEYNVSKQ